nr:hypothetical protein [Tanacetum cinerariifolium]
MMIVPILNWNTVVHNVNECANKEVQNVTDANANVTSNVDTIVVDSIVNGKAYDDTACAKNVNGFLNKNGNKGNTLVDIVTSYAFFCGKITVKYLELPLITKQLSVSECKPLIEKMTDDCTLADAVGSGNWKWPLNGIVSMLYLAIFRFQFFKNEERMRLDGLIIKEN